jgi:hypothetical protein
MQEKKQSLQDTQGASRKPSRRMIVLIVVLVFFGGFMILGGLFVGNTKTYHPVGSRRADGVQVWIRPSISETGVPLLFEYYSVGPPYSVVVGCRDEDLPRLKNRIAKVVLRREGESDVTLSRIGSKLEYEMPLDPEKHVECAVIIYLRVSDSSADGIRSLKPHELRLESRHEWSMVFWVNSQGG